MKKLLLLCMALSVGLFSCGGLGKDVAGSLTMTDIVTKDQGGGTYSVEASAIYVPDNSKDPSGAELSFTATYTTPSGSSATKTGSITIGKSGGATFTDWKAQGNEPYFLVLTVSIGGLSYTKTSSIPAVSALAVTPSSVAFPNTDPVGTSTSVTVTGGYAPYTVASEIPADIQAGISGSIITITKFALGSTTLAATKVTITDNKGSYISIPVGYYK